jgi:hypothetical protein
MAGEFTDFPASISLAQHDVNVATNDMTRAGGRPVMSHLATQQTILEAQTCL